VQFEVRRFTLSPEGLANDSQAVWLEQDHAGTVCCVESVRARGSRFAPRADVTTHSVHSSFAGDEALRRRSLGTSTAGRSGRRFSSLLRLLDRGV
jgi:hypothetical protein